MASTVQANKIRKKKDIPRELIYEEMDGQPIYYAGYQEVINSNKTLDDIMGSSSLQAVIIKLLLKYLYAHIDDNGYEVYTNETGLHLSKGNNLSSDIAIYKSSDIQKYTMDEHYFDIPPEIVVEVDTKADLTNIKWEKYLEQKNKKLFAFGVKKVIWVLSASKQLILAGPDQDWLIRDWHKSFEIVPSHVINLGDMLKKKGVK